MDKHVCKRIETLRANIPGHRAMVEDLIRRNHDAPAGSKTYTDAEIMREWFHRDYTEAITIQRDNPVLPAVPNNEGDAWERFDRLQAWCEAALQAIGTNKVHWDDINPSYVPLSNLPKRSGRFAGMGLTVASKRLRNPGCRVRYMNKGQRTKVHLGDAGAYPEDLIGPEATESTEQAIGDALADDPSPEEIARDRDEIRRQRANR